ncbi:ADP-ribose glycohydrolase MACROD1-like [Saccoglossus kowalevskii]
MPIEEKRKLYACRNDYVTLDQVPTWTEYKNKHISRIERIVKKEKPLFCVNETLNEKVSIWRGDITTLEIDAIGNAANSSLMGGGGVDGCIHRSAGPTLKKECATFNGCKTGDAKITSGYKLPAKYVIHTVGPMGEDENKLESCYKTSLNILKKHSLRTLAMPCVSTGIYGYPNDKAGSVVLATVRNWLDVHGDSVDRIIFCLFLQEDVRIYESLLPLHFPSNDDSWFMTEEHDHLPGTKEDKSPKTKIPKRNEDESNMVTEEGALSGGSKDKQEGTLLDESSLDVKHEDVSLLAGGDLKTDKTDIQKEDYTEIPVHDGVYSLIFYIHIRKEDILCSMATDEVKPP